MAKVYKYVESKYTNAMSMGFVYINTFSAIRKIDNNSLLAKIRKTDTQNEPIFDTREGLATNSSGKFHVQNISAPENEGQKKLLEQFIPLKIAGDTEVIIQNSVSVTMLKDAYMFCTTTRRDDLYWKKEANYDTCFEIRDYSLFCKRLLNALFQSYPQNGKLHYSSEPCNYEEIEGNLEEGNLLTPNYFRKHKIYQPQNEVRVVVILEDNTPISPKTVWVNPDGLFRVVN